MGSATGESTADPLTFTCQDGCQDGCHVFIGASDTCVCGQGKRGMGACMGEFLNKGWVCPKCGKAWAPWIPSCWQCEKDYTCTVGATDGRH